MDLSDGPPIILPKGIVHNTREIYDEVASFEVIPFEKIHKYWSVYTTTSKELKDPTAQRLEHFWWHVWGSDLRFRSGKALAKVYQDISNGPTFVPLRSTANRWEGPNMPPIMPALIRHAHSADSRGGTGEASTAKPHRQVLAADNELRSLSSSASKPPPAHPILKKSRGPASSSGPRPTARFLSPHQSADEDEKEPGVASNSTLIRNAASRDSEISSSTFAKKRTSGGNKRFVVSASNKRRPMMPPRKGSSQNSITSEAGSREVPSSADSKDSTSQPTFPPLIERDETSITESPKEAMSAGGVEEMVPSAKALGKRPVVPHWQPSEQKIADLSHAPSSNLSDGDKAVLDDTSFPRCTLKADLPAPDTQANGRTQGNEPGSAGAPRQRPHPGPTGAAAMGRSQSHTGYDRAKQKSHFSKPMSGLFTSATASTTITAAQGTIIDQSGSLPPVSPLLGPPMSHSIPSHSSTTSLLDPRLRPTPPSTVEAVPLGRTKSQLTLLLERDQGRGPERSRGTK